MFLIYSETEDSLSPVQDDKVVCDLNTVKIGDKVSFIWKGELCSGEVKLITGEFF